MVELMHRIIQALEAIVDATNPAVISLAWCWEKVDVTNPGAPSHSSKIAGRVGLTAHREAPM